MCIRDSHTRAMHLYHQGMPMMLLSEYLGHASEETTKVYAYADTEMKRAAIDKADIVDVYKRQGIPLASDGGCAFHPIPRKLPPYGCEFHHSAWR